MIRNIKVDLVFPSSYWFPLMAKIIVKEKIFGLG